MAQGYGYKGYVGFGTESTWGSAAGTANYSFVELNAGADGLDVTEERLHTASVYSLNMDKDQMAKGPISVAGDLSFDMRYEGFEKLFKCAFGSVDTTQPEGTDVDVYQHEFTIADTLGTGLTIEIGKDASAFQATGCMINNLTFDITNTGFLGLTVGIIGKDIGTAGTVSPSFPTAPLVVFSEGTVSYAGTATDVETASITLNNNLSDDRRYIGSRTIKQPLRSGKIEVTGTFTINFTSVNEYDDFRDAQERALQLKFEGATISGGTSPYTVQIDCPYIRLTGGLPKIDDEGPIKVELPFKAYSDGTDKELKLTLINAVSSV